MEEIQNAIVIMLIGMLTVSAVLTLIVLLGNFTIKLSNKLYSVPSVVLPSGDGTDVETIAVLTAAVGQLTAGKGRVEEIHRID